MHCNTAMNATEQRREADSMTSKAALTPLPPHCPREAIGAPLPQTPQLCVCVFRPLLRLCVDARRVKERKGERGKQGKQGQEEGSKAKGWEREGSATAGESGGSYEDVLLLDLEAAPRRGLRRGSLGHLDLSCLSPSRVGGLFCYWLMR